MKNIPTPHIECEDPSQIASTVLMPGDPLRAKFIAETYLTDVIQFNSTRGMLGFTGYYNGKRVSVMGSGMGIPSAMIYYHELYSFYGVETIIRIGTAGGFQDYLELRDIILATAACSSSQAVKKFGNISFAPTPDFDLLLSTIEVARKKEVKVHVGTVLSGDEFYDGTDAQHREKLIQYGVLAAEMESAGLFMTARKLGKKALAMFTISDSEKGQESSKDRQNAYTDMMEIALEVAPE